MILAIDTGITTGYAVVEDDGTFIRSGNLNMNSLQLLKPYIDFEATVIIEYAMTPTNSIMNRQLAKVNAEIRNMFPSAYTVTPSQWKTSKTARTIILGRTRLSQHQKDAIHIAAYFVANKTSFENSVKKT